MIRAMSLRAQLSAARPPATSRAARSLVQRRARVSAPDDVAEREADAIADRVMRGSPTTGLLAIRAPVTAKQVSTSCAGSGGAAHEVSGAQWGTDDPEPLTRGGEPLPAAVRTALQPRFGLDFGRVRIHADAEAAASADAFDAEAYTAGRHIVFGSGRYDPGTPAGQRLLVHELTHVVQQGHAAALERAGDGSSVAAAHGGGTVQRKCKQCEDEQAAVVQRTPRARRRRARRRPRTPGRQVRGAQAPIVEDGGRAGRGQMTKTLFLNRLRDELLRATEAELAPVGRTSRDCPYILRTIEHYASRPVAMLLRLIQRFAHPPAGASAEGLIAATVTKARLAARYLAQHGTRAQAMSTRPDRAIASHDPASVRARLGSGSALDRSVRARLEPGFGWSFDDVRIHADASAARLSDDLGARAFTIDNHIAFGRGEYRPGTPTGDALIAHELAHTIQQRHAATELASGGGEAALERQADRAAAGALAGAREAGAGIEGAAPGPRIQRDPVDDTIIAIAFFAATAGPVAVDEGVVLTEEAPAIVETLAPQVETFAPQIESMLPELESAAPQLESVAPQLESVAPQLESAAPQVQSVAPSYDVAVQQAVDMAPAIADQAQQAIESTSSESSSNEDPQRRCREMHPSALVCDELGISRDEAAVEFLMSEGYDPNDLLDCQGVSSFGADTIAACDGAPGESWHCNVRGARAPLSIFGCLCCNVDGTTGWEWRGPHWSVNLSRRGSR
jgi:hypothetical protein